MGTYIEKLKPYEEKMNFEKKGLTITVSGLSGSGKTAFAKALAHELGLKYVSIGDLFRELAEEKGMSIEEFSKVRDKKIDLEADAKMLKLAKKGGYVLVGRLSGFVAGDDADLRILIFTDLETRARRVANRDKKDLEEARQDLIERDNANTERYKELYGIDDQNDFSIYDLIIDNTDLTYEELTKEKIDEVKKLLKEKGLL